MTTERRWGRTRALVLFGIIVAAQFVLFESAMRLWGSSEAAPSFQGLFTDHPIVGYRLKPGARTRFETVEFAAQIDINSSGVRDSEELGPKPPGEQRIVILGDSLVLAVQVDFHQTFGELLEQRLNASAPPGRRYRVINAGVQGYGPVEELLFFRTIARDFEPDLVVTTLFVGNDAEEAVNSERRLNGDTRPVAAALRDDVMTRLRRLVRRSMVLQVLRLRVMAATNRLVPKGAPPEAPLQSYAAGPAAPRIDRGLDITRRAVAGIAAEAAAVGARTAVAFMPARFQVDDGDYGRLKAAVAQAGGELDRDGANRRFEQALSSLAVPRIDLLPSMRAAGGALFYQQTVHLTPHGHEVVARALEGFLKERGLLGVPAGNTGH